MTRKIRDQEFLGSVDVETIVVPLESIMDSGCKVIFEHWNEMKGDRIGPSWREFDLLGLASKYIRNTHVVDIAEDAQSGHYRYWGTGLTKVLYYDRTGQSMLNVEMGYLDEQRRDQVLADHLTVVESGAPMPFLWDASSRRNMPYRLIVPSIRLPLSDDDTRVKNVLTYFDFSSQKSHLWQEMFDIHNRIDDSSTAF